MKKTIRVIAIAIMIVICALAFCGCDYSTVNMPPNGEIVFHDIFLTVPETFIRDSTRSNEDLWVFEHGGYKQYILISRTDAEDKTLEDYASAMESVGAECNFVDDGIVDGVISKVTNDKKEYCQELYFFYNESAYAVALRGATDEDFKALINTITFAKI